MLRICGWEGVGRGGGDEWMQHAAVGRDARTISVRLLDGTGCRETTGVDALSPGRD